MSRNSTARDRRFRCARASSRSSCCAKWARLASPVSQSFGCMSGSFFGSDLVGDVMGHPDEVGNRAVCVAHRRDAHVVPPGAAIRAVDQQPAVRRATLSQRLAHRLGRTRVGVRALKETARRPDDLGGAVAGDPFERGVDVHQRETVTGRSGDRDRDVGRCHPRRQQGRNVGGRTGLGHAGPSRLVPSERSVGEPDWARRVPQRVRLYGSWGAPAGRMCRSA